MATIGSKLISAESGWTRYDNTNSNITFVGMWTHETDTTAYNNTRSFANVINASAKFNVIGTKIRIIGSYFNNRSNNISIKIDGITEVFSMYSTSGDSTGMYLCYEKTGLSNIEHHVEITNNTNNYIVIDAIDIDSTGILKPYNSSKYLIQDKNSILYTATGHTDNLIPTMTSNTAPSGVASASSIYNVSYDAYKAFDKNMGDNRWATGSTTVAGWLCYDFGSSLYAINKYTITALATTDFTQHPKNWTFEGSQDGSVWNILDTQTNITNWSSEVKKEFIFNNGIKYRYYRINISANNGGSISTVPELEMYSINIVQNPSQILDDNNFKTNGFSDATIISENIFNTKFPDKTDVKILMWTDDIDKKEAKLVYNCDQFDLTQWLKDNQCNLLLWTDDMTKTSANMIYDCNPYKPIDLLENEFDVLEYIK